MKLRNRRSSQPRPFEAGAVTGANRRALLVSVLLAFSVLPTGGCMKSLFNSWLDPATVGHFNREGTSEIRSALSIQDSPLGVPGATDPQPEDLVPVYEEYSIEPGDQLTVRVLDLLARGVETPAQVRVNEVGVIRLPVVGRVRAAGLTPAELETEVADYLEQREVLRNAQVIVEPVVRRGASYGIYGAISSPNIYPLSKPDLKLLEAINFAGGLPDVVTRIYVFREEDVGPTLPEAPPDFPLPDGTRDDRIEQDEPGLPLSLTAMRREGGQFDGNQPVESFEPPPGINEDEARRELRNAVLSTETSPADQDATGIEGGGPLPESRWTWLESENQWVEIQPPAADDDPVGTPPDLRPPRVLDEPQPSIDWSEIAEETQQRIIAISPEALRNGDMRQNIIVRPGDTIRLTAGETGEYYMMGQINRPGSYSLAGRTITLKTAVAAAGNLAALAWPSRCTVYRRHGDREEMIQVNIDRIFTGEDPDFYIKKNDLIVVGTHPAAVFLAVLRSAFRLTYGFGFVYDRNFADVDQVRRQIETSARTQAKVARETQFQGLFQ